MIRSGVRSSDRIVWRIFFAKRSGPRRPSPSLAGRTTSRRWVSNPAIAARAVSAAACRRGVTAATAGSSAWRLGLGERVVDQRRRSPGSCLSAVSVWNRPTGRPSTPTRVSRAPSRTSGRPSSRLATDASRSPSGANSRASRSNRPLADEIHPLERVPRVLAQLALGELRGGDLAEDQVAVDRLVGAEAAQAFERRLPAVHRRESLGAAGLGRIGPQAVEAVVADRGRGHRIEPEQVVEERPEDIVERGHASQTPMAARSSRKSQPRRSPGSMRTTTPAVARPRRTTRPSRRRTARAMRRIAGRVRDVGRAARARGPRTRGRAARPRRRRS